MQCLEKHSLVRLWSAQQPSWLRMPRPPPAAPAQRHSRKVTGATCIFACCCPSFSLWNSKNICFCGMNEKIVCCRCLKFAVFMAMLDRQRLVRMQFFSIIFHRLRAKLARLMKPLIFPAFSEKTRGINLVSPLYVGEGRLRGATETHNDGERARKGSKAGPV